MKSILTLLAAVVFFSAMVPNPTATNMNDVKTIELVLFKTRASATTEEAQKALTQLNDFLKTQEGYIARYTALGDDEQFLDLVLWESLEQAKAAAKAAEQSEEAGQVFQIIEPESMTFKHFAVFNRMVK